MKKLFILCALLLVSTHSLSAHQINRPFTDSTRNSIPVCSDFGCKNRLWVNLSSSEWQQVFGWFQPEASTPKQEREQIKRAIGWMEVLVGQHTPSHKDIAYNLPPDADIDQLFPGQQDCIDEATNTTTYLRYFEKHGLLKYHTVTEQAYRKGILRQHWAGQIMERSNGKRWVIDSWFYPNGYLPVVQTSADWVAFPYAPVIDRQLSR